MKDEERKLYGVVAGYSKISFVLDGFQCVFINADIGAKERVKIRHKNGFILGQTTNGRYVYLYTNDDLEVQSQVTFHTWLYFVSAYPDIERYEKISFAGGILDKLFFKSAVNFDYDEPSQTKLKYKDDCQSYLLSNEKIKGDISICSKVCESVSAEKGSAVTNSEAELEISFEEEKEIQTFSEIFGYVMSMCRFMTFRKNVRFEKIYLKRKSVQYPKIADEIAECYVRYEEAAEVEKSIYSCITFNDLGECIGGLMDSIVNNRPKKPRFHMGFIPENEKDVPIVTSMKVREICSALESEMELAGIGADQEDEFEELVKQLKALVKEHRDGARPLSDEKAYDYILGTLDHLTGALADRIEKCFIEYQPALGEYISRRQIDEIVKYRNTITHGNYMPLNERLAETAYVLIKLVYCCVLKRIGMEDDKIKNLFGRRIIS